MSESSQQIVVSGDPTLDQLKSAARILLASITSWAVGKGYITPDVGGALTTIVLIGGPLLWGQIEAVLKKRTLVAAATSHPESVTVKS